MRLITSVAILVGLVSTPARGSGPRVRALAGPVIPGGTAPRIVVDGAKPGERLTVRAYRRVVLETRSAAGLRTDTTIVASWARLRADARGHIDVDTAMPTAGSWRERDPLAVFWSMEPIAGPGAYAPPRGRILLALERGSAVIDTSSFAIGSVPGSLTERVVVQPGVVGAFAAPSDARPHPALLLLHGSEGGDTVSGRTMARRFAARGYAALAVVYVAYGGPFAGIAPSFDNVPVETLTRARQWLGAQPEADTSRTGIWGVSKGGELAVVAASYLRWPRAVVACVPSDVVWAGYGRQTPSDVELSSWSVDGRPLPAIPYDHYEDVFAFKATSREVHDRSRLRDTAAARRAEIPVERIAAPILLLGGESDETWASASQARAVASRMTAKGNGALATVGTYARTQHGMCGDGTTPGSYFSASADTASGRGTARAAADAWRRTVAFLDRALKR